MAKAGDITNGLCHCVNVLGSALPTEEFINWFDDSSSHVTYRAVLTRTETVSAVDIEQWEGHSKHHTDRKYILIEYT